MDEALIQAFPSSLRPSLYAAVAGLPRGVHPSHGSIVTSNSRRWPEITVLGELVEIPGRIYNDEAAIDLLPADIEVRSAIDCLYTRHCDGFVRQAALRRVLPVARSWAVPFIVQLLGEYVIEICEDIQRFAESEIEARLNLAPEIRSFAVENPAFIELTRQRATSYWDCHYRGTHLYRDAYPGLRALQLLLDCERG